MARRPAKRSRPGLSGEPDRLVTTGDEQRPDRPEDADNATLAGVPVGTNGAPAPFLTWAANAERQSQDFAKDNLKGAWQRSYRAFRNSFFDGSKYLTNAWAHRSKLFRPKTRIAVRKQLASTATALFSTDDVVKIEAEYDDDPISKDGAAVNHHLLNYRLDRTSVRAGIPWFMIALGAAFDAIVTGVCFSKQFWEFEEVETDEMEDVPITDEATGQPVMQLAIDPMTGQPQIDPATMQPAMVPIMSQRPKMRTVRDRPMILPIPPENVILDMGAPWYDPVQLGAYFIARYPMTVEEVRQMIASPSTGLKGGQRWLPVDEKILTQVAEDYDARGVRIAREGGQDRFASTNRRPSAHHNIVWVHENFFRWRGRDYSFWSVGTRAYLSNCVETIESYPSMQGDRPYCGGVGAIEPHRLYPMSHVESWQPLQMEANDLANLRLDALKQAISPIAKIRQGSTFDVNALQQRGAGGTNIMVRSMDDLDFATWPTPSGQAYLEANHLNADMDDLSGTFSQGSVSTNRSMNETVGGMNLLNGSANAVSEYDLRVWVETWVEPVLRQTMKNLQYYETDEVALAVAGKRAQVRGQITDDMMMREYSCKVNVGIGAADPMQRLAKLRMALEMLVAAAPFLDQAARVKAEELIPEVMGAAGFKDGKRFFELSPRPEGGSPEDAIAMKELELEQAAQALEKLRIMMEGEAKAATNQTVRDNAEMAAQVDLLIAMVNQMGQAKRAEVQAEAATSRAAVQGFAKHTAASKGGK